VTPVNTVDHRIADGIKETRLFILKRSIFSHGPCVTDSPPVRRPGRPRRDESGDVELRLIDASMRMLIEHGPSLTMNTIISASGLSRKTVYARYPNKTALFAAVIRQMLGYARDPLLIPPRPDWRESLFAFVEDCLAEVCEPHATAMRRLLMLNPSFMDEARPQIEQVVVRRYLDPLTGYLQSLVDENVLPDQDVAFAAEALTSLILSESHRRFFQGEADEAIDRAQLSRHARRLTDLFCGGIMGTGQN
jgi:AcrR family transcriptional regulator